VSAAVSIVTGLFTSAAAGLLAALLPAPFLELRRFFFATNAFIGMIFLALAGFLRPLPEGGPTTWGIGETAWCLGVAALVLSATYVAALYLPAGRPRRGVLAAAAVAAAAATALDGRAAAPEQGGGPAWLFVAGALAAAALLGTVMVAMLLGHWYLVRSRLAVEHLVRYAKLLGGVVGLRAALLLTGLLLAGAAAPQGAAEYLRAVTLDRGFFFWQRVFFGILGPAVFAFMVHETARIRSTQSATGILYIAVIFVLYGELLARFLTVAGSGPM
jgi:hypothetical protein